MLETDTFWLFPDVITSFESRCDYFAPRILNASISLAEFALNFEDCIYLYANAITMSALRV